MGTQKSKKQKISTIEQQILDSNEPVKVDELIAQIVYEWGSTRHHARNEYIKTLEDLGKIVRVQIDEEDYLVGPDEADEYVDSAEDEEGDSQHD